MRQEERVMEGKAGNARRVWKAQVQMESDMPELDEEGCRELYTEDRWGGVEARQQAEAFS